MTILCFPKVNYLCIIIVGDINYKGGYSEMVNKIVEVLTKALVALTDVLGPVLNTLLKKLWAYTDKVWYSQGYEKEDHTNGVIREDK